MPRQTVIIGPTKAGKTYYLAALFNAARTAWNIADIPFSCRLFPSNAETKKLDRQSAKIIETGKLPFDASLHVTKYEFDVEVNLNRGLWDDFFTSFPFNAWPLRFFFSSGVSTGRFSVMDGPGRALFGDPDEMDDENLEFRKELIQTAKNADGLIICLDATDDHEDDTVSQFVQGFPSILDEIGNPLPFERIAVVLTKADMFLAGKPECKSQNWHELMAERNPWDRALELMTENGLGVLQQYLGPRTEVVAGWCSAYGFYDGDGGRSNCDPDTGRLRSLGDGKHKGGIRGWKPFRLLDPLIYLTAGEFCSLRPLEQQLTNWKRPNKREEVDDSV